MKKACKGHLQHMQQMLVYNYIGNVKNLLGTSGFKQLCCVHG